MAELYSNFRWGFTGEDQYMLVNGGRVVARAASPPPAEVASDASVIDLGGRLLLPSFIDAHCHILPTGLDLKKLNLDSCSTKEAVLECVLQRHNELDESEWLMAIRYDQTKFADGSHLHRDELDGISKTRPIILRQVSGHASVANSAALAAARVDESTPDPKGGAFGRDASGRLSGLLLEDAHEAVTSASPSPTLDDMVEAILTAGEKMASLGIGCASDMMTGRYDLDLELQAYRIAAERGCKIRTRLYVQWGRLFGPRAIDWDRFQELNQEQNERWRVSGVKIFADGAIGSATAAIYGHFTGSPPEREIDGQLIYPPEKLKQMVRTAHDAGYRLAIHSIGDRSTDIVMDAFEALGGGAARHRIEHAMILSDAQIDRMATLGVHCCMQPEFLMFFRHAYRRQLGEERASRLNRYRSVKDAGIPLSFSSDRPIVSGDPWDGIHAAESRPDGFDPSENLTREEALPAYTTMAAAANGEQDELGGLNPGEWADFQVISPR